MCECLRRHSLQPFLAKAAESKAEYFKSKESWCVRFLASSDLRQHISSRWTRL